MHNKNIENAAAYFAPFAKREDPGDEAVVVDDVDFSFNLLAPYLVVNSISFKVVSTKVKDAKVSKRCLQFFHPTEKAHGFIKCQPAAYTK